jgi:hypothetical protein
MGTNMPLSGIRPLGGSHQEKSLFNSSVRMRTLCIMTSFHGHLIRYLLAQPLIASLLCQVKIYIGAMDY